MSIWLRKTLFIWLSAVALVILLWNARVSQARDENYWREAERRLKPNRKLTKEQAAKYFAAMVETGDYASWQKKSRTVEAQMVASISRKSDRELDGKFTDLLDDMLGYTLPGQTVRVRSITGDIAIIVVRQDRVSLDHPLILVEEDGGWSVDLVETYLKWKAIDPRAKDEVIYHFTGIETPGVPAEYDGARQKVRYKFCQENLHAIGLGFMQYTQDYDEKLPLARTWQSEGLLPYVRTEIVFNCPSVRGGKRYGYAYNAKLAGKAYYIFSDPGKIVSLYEVSDLKPNAAGTGQYLTFRHEGVANYGFLTGAVTHLPKEKVPSFNLGRTVVSPKVRPLYW